MVLQVPTYEVLLLQRKIDYALQEENLISVCLVHTNINCDMNRTSIKAIVIFVLFQDKDISLSGEHVREGLTCIISVKVPNPEFEGQTKVLPIHKISLATHVFGCHDALANLILVLAITPFIDDA